jgi:ABC-type nitrate/sulfonate/bicarbonate transport system substrate-binding protein
MGCTDKGCRNEGERHRRIMPVSEPWRKNNVKIIRVVEALVFIAFFAYGPVVRAADLYKAVVPYTPLTGATTPFWIAVEERRFQKYGLEVAPLFVSAGSSVIVPAMVSRQFDIGLASGAAVVLNRLAGGDLLTIGAQTGVYTTDCFSKPEIKSINDLKGKTVGVTRLGTSTHFAALSMLRSAGLKPTDVVFIQIGGSAEAIAGLVGGKVDAAMLGYPASEVALKKGFTQLSHLAKTENGAFPTTAIVVRESWLKDTKNREIAGNFLRAFTEGLILAKSDAGLSKKVLRKYTRVEDDAILLSTFEYYRQFFGDSLKINERSYANLLQLVDHPKAKGADPKQFFDNSLVEQLSR